MPKQLQKWKVYKTVWSKGPVACNVQGAEQYLGEMWVDKTLTFRQVEPLAAQQFKIKPRDVCLERTFEFQDA